MSIETQQFDIKIVRGKTLEFRMKLKDAEGVGVDLTGCIIRIQGRKSFNSTAALFSYTSDEDNSPITIEDQETSRGWLKWKLTPDQTTALPIASGVYEAEITYLNDDADRMLWGNFNIQQEVVR